MPTTRFTFLLGILAIAGSLHASTFSFSTPTGATDLANNPLSVQSIFVVSGNQIQITVDNHASNPIDDGQILDAMTFQLTNQAIPAGATISFSGSITEAITINTNGTFTPVATCSGGNLSGCLADEMNWTATDTITGPANHSTIQFDFCDANIVAAGCPSSSSHTYASADGIIGGPSTNSQYTHSGIKSGANNPYIFEQATVDITLSSGTFNLPQDNYTNLIFGFGSLGADEDAILAVTPEPPTFWTIAAALAAGLAAINRRG